MEERRLTPSEAWRGSYERPEVELVFVDEQVLQELVEVATTDAAPDDVTPPLGEGWAPDRVDWLRAYHRLRRTGLAGGDEETAAIRVDGRVVGATRLHRSSSVAADHMECGIWLSRSSRGRGLGDAVLRLVVLRAAELGASRLVARTATTNAPAMAVLQRAGATLSTRDDGTVYAEIPLDDGILSRAPFDVLPVRPTADAFTTGRPIASEHGHTDTSRRSGRRC